MLPVLWCLHFILNTAMRRPDQLVVSCREVKTIGLARPSTLGNRYRDGDMKRIGQDNKL